MSDKRKSKNSNPKHKISRRTLLEGTATVAVGSILPALPVSAAEKIIVSVGIEKMAIMDRKWVMAKDKNLAYAASTDPEATVAVLRKQIPSLTVRQISVDKEGRVLIKNERFAREISDAIRLNEEWNLGCVCNICW